MPKISRVISFIRALPLDKIPPRLRRKIIMFIIALIVKRIGKKVFK